MRLFVYILITLLIITVQGLSSKQSDAYENEWLSLDELMTMEIKTAGKKAEKTAEIPASVVIVSDEEIRRYGYRNIQDILRQITGFYLVEQYPWNGVTGFGVRGYSTEGSFSNVIIMINGNNIIREGYADQYVLSRLSVPIESIKRIEVIRGPMAVMYGSGAFFGAINIVTFDENQKNDKTHVSINYGTHNSKKVYFGTEKSVDDIHYSVNLSINSTDGIDIPYTELASNTLDTNTGKTYLEQVGLENNSRTKEHFKSLSNYLRLSVQHSDLFCEMGFLAENKGIMWFAPSLNENGNYININGFDFNIQYEKQLPLKLSFLAKALYSNYSSKSHYHVMNDDIQGSSLIKSSNASYELNLFHNPNDNLEFMLAYQYEMLIDASNSVDIPQINQTNSRWKIKEDTPLRKHSIYSQINFKPIEQLSLVGGVRSVFFQPYTYQRIKNLGMDNLIFYEAEYEQKNAHIDYRLGAVYNIYYSHFIKVLYGTATTEPSLRENTSRLENIFTYELGTINNLQLEPSQIQTFEVVYEALLLEWLSINLSYFSNQLNNIIESSGTTDSAGTYVVITQNTGEVQANGIEWAVNIKPDNTLDFSFRGSYQESKNLKSGFENIELGYSPTWLLYVKGSWEFLENLSIAVNAIYVDFMKASWNARGINPELGERYGKEVPEYILVNLNLKYKNIYYEGLSLNLYINNLLDSEIRFPTEPSNRWVDKGFLDYGRTIYLGMGYEF